MAKKHKDKHNVSRPLWVPESARCHIDLVGNRAWVESVGEVAVDTLLGSDPDTAGWFGQSAYEAASLTADGYVNEVAIALIGAARDLITADAGATVVKKWKATAEFTDLNPQLLIHNPDASSFLWFEAGGQRTRMEFQGAETRVISDLNTVRNGDGETNALAITVAPTYVNAAVNGNLLVDGAITSNDWPQPNVFTVAAIQLDDPLQSVTIYDPLPSGSPVLNTLSA